MFNRYKQTIDNYIKQGYARKLTEEEKGKASSRIWYLPHHSVFNPKKIRVVFDVVAKDKRQSLNSSLCTGPDLLNSVIGVLIRFRRNDIAIVADVEAMFHQVRVKPLDCDSLQFLWADTPEENQR